MEDDSTLMDDSVSCLLHGKTDYLTKVPQFHDPHFITDLREHLEMNVEYRKERRVWSKKKPTEHVAWSVFRMKDEFFWVYTESFLNDLEIFKRNNPDGRGVEFCGKFRGYGSVYGEEFVERAFRKLGYLKRYYE